MMKSVGKFIKSETVLSVAAILAIVSCFAVHPDKTYVSYIDFRTLAILFSLMTVMAGLRRQGVFDHLGRSLLGKSKHLFQVILVLVFLCFFCSMVITNDVSLITFVPFSFAVLQLIGAETRKQWIVPVVCMQTIAANLGSMLTPLGNPQNLYLYGKSGLNFGAFLILMLPYTALSFLMLFIWIFLKCRTKGQNAEMKCDFSEHAGMISDRKKIGLYGILFGVCLLTVLRIIPYPVMFGIVLAVVLITDRTTLARVDYSLLLTFVAFFVFIGNLGRIPLFSDWLCSILSGREVLASILASQVTSNVPAALLLSGFTDRIDRLIVGTNLGGFGTLIASMASLISYRQIAVGEPEQKKVYFQKFTVSNVLFLIVLYGLFIVIAGK